MQAACDRLSQRAYRGNQDLGGNHTRNSVEPGAATRLPSLR